MKKSIVTPQAPAPIGPYSQAIATDHFLFCSGQIPINPATGNVEAQDVVGQTEQVMKNIGAVLAAGDRSFKDVVKTTIFLKSMEDFPKVNEIYGKYLSEPFPARSTVEVARLPKGVLVEIEVLAQR